jgi:hypothetical protein
LQRGFFPAARVQLPIGEVICCAHRRFEAAPRRLLIRIWTEASRWNQAMRAALCLAYCTRPIPIQVPFVRRRRIAQTSADRSRDTQQRVDRHATDCDWKSSEIVRVLE